MDDLNRYIHKDKKFELIKQNSNGEKKRYVSYFLSDSLEFYTIAPPSYNDESCELLSGEEVELYVYVPNGVYSLICKVLEANRNYYRLSLPKSVRHTQRREFLRVNKQCRVNIKVHKTGGGIASISALSIDLCGRGVGLMLNTPIGEYSKIEVELLLDKQVITTLAEVVHSRALDTSMGLKYRTALMFISVTDKDVDAIVKECLLFQLQEKNKMLKNQV